MPAGPVGPRTQSGISDRSIRDQAIVPRHLHADLFAGKYFKQNWPSVAPTASGVNGYAAPAGTTGATNFAHLRGLAPMTAAYHIKGAGQTILAPFEVAAGLDAGLDQTLAEGVEYVFGDKLIAANPFSTTIEAQASYPKILRLRLSASVVANAAECAIGFRKAEAFQANFDDYDELAALNMQVGVVNIETILNGVGPATVDTGETMANAVARTLEVWLMGRELRFFVDGVQFKSTFNFDVGEVVVPFMFWLQVTGGAQLIWEELEVGALWHLKKDINRR